METFNCLRKEKTIAAAATFVFFAALPKLFFLPYWHQLSDYKLMWLNFLGKNYALTIEAPKPFMVILSGLVHPSMAYLTACLACAFMVAASIELSKILSGRITGGLFAAFFWLLCNKETVTYIFSVAWPVFYVPIAVWSIVFILKKQYTRAFLAIFVLGLIRPEAWLYYIISLAWVAKEKARLHPAICLLPLLAPILWIFMDYRISGDMLYTYHITAKYTLVHNLPPTTFLNFWPALWDIIKTSYSLPIILAGIGGIIFFIYKKRLQGGHLYLALFGLAPIMLYWIACGFKNINVHTRFFAFSWAMIYFYAAFFIADITRKNKAAQITILGLLFLQAASWNNITSAIRGWAETIPSEKTSLELCRFLKNYLPDDMKGKKIVTDGNVASFFLYLGESFSHNVLTLREITHGPSILNNSIPDIYIYQYYFTPPPEYYFNNLINRGKIKNNTRHNFKPVFITSQGYGVVYENKP